MRDDVLRHRFIKTITFLTFSVLRKKGLIDIESNDKGEVMHIGQGDKLNNVDISAGGCHTELTKES